MEADVGTSDESSDPTTDEPNEPATMNNFDPVVTTEHSYLGKDLESLPGTTFLDLGVCLKLPILLIKSVIFFPGQTLPMIEYSTKNVEMFRMCVQKDHTFGVVGWCDTRMGYGTTAEIYEYSDNERHGFRMKAIGRQRFKILRMTLVNSDNQHFPLVMAERWIFDGFAEQGTQIFADVKILDEVVLGPPTMDIRLASLDRLRKIPTNEEEAKEQEYKLTRRDSIVTPWPSWIYRQYDVRRLVMRIHERLKYLTIGGSNIPKDPTELSFWLAQNLFMTDHAKLEILQYDCAIDRLRYEDQILTSLSKKGFMCKHCRTVIAKYNDLVLMNKASLQAAYCNPLGAIHETVTVSRASGVTLSREPPSTQCSWFPGYAWRIASCSNCRAHIGWQFTAVRRNLNPSKFWGLAGGNLVFDEVTQKGYQTARMSTGGLLPGMRTG